MPYIYRHRLSLIHMLPKTIDRCVPWWYTCPFKYIVSSALGIFKRSLWNPLTLMDCSIPATLPRQSCRQTFPTGSCGFTSGPEGLSVKSQVRAWSIWVGCPGCDAENWGYSNSLILFVSLDITKPNLGSKSLQTHRGVKWCKYVGMFPWLAVHTSPFFWTWEFFVANLTAQQRITERRQSRSVSKSQVSQRKSTRHARRKREQKPATGSRCSVFFKNFCFTINAFLGLRIPTPPKSL